MKPGDFPQPTPAVAARPNDVRLVIKFGRQRRRQIKQLKRGDGLLAQHVQAAVDRRRAELGIDGDAEIVPVVVLYRREEPDYVVIMPRDDTRPVE